MSRATHDRDLDHHGTEPPSVIALAEALERYLPGSLLDALLEDALARLAVLENKAGIYSFSADAITLDTMTGSFYADAVAS
jgi:proline dehydrogenase